MITAEQVKSLIDDKLVEKDCFVVELEIASGNQINLEVDGMNGFSIQDCIEFSRAIENNLDREEEDFELHVSSPGLDKPLRVIQQYQKNVGRDVKVVLKEGNVVKGELKKVDEVGIVVEYSYKERIEGKKKKQTIIKEEEIQFDNIKETTLIISFNK